MNFEKAKAEWGELLQAKSIDEEHRMELTLEGEYDEKVEILE